MIGNQNPMADVPVSLHCIKGDRAPAFGTFLTGVFTFVDMKMGSDYLVRTNLSGEYPHDFQAARVTTPDSGASNSGNAVNNRDTAPAFGTFLTGVFTFVDMKMGSNYLVRTNLSGE
jgi:hypothetical protein